MNRGRLLPLRELFTSSSMRLVVLVSTLFAAATILSGFTSYFIQLSESRDKLLSEAQQTSAVLVNIYNVAGRAELEEAINTNMLATRDNSNLYLFLADGGESSVGNFRLAHPVAGAHRLTEGVDFRLLDKQQDNEGEEYVVFAARVVGGWVLTGRDTKWISDNQEIMLQSFAWGLGVSLLASISLAIYLAYRSEIRIARLTQVLTDASFGNMNKRYHEPENASDDIARIAVLVNQMLDRLAQSMESLKQVSTDVAHDLRAPLTRLRTRIEPHFQREDIPSDTRDALQKAMADLESIVSTFDAMLRLAQIESGSQQFHRETVDLGQLTAEMHEMLLPVATDMGHRFELTCDDGLLTVSGDKRMLAQVIVNLVENAFRHCPAPATIKLSVRRIQSDIVLCVKDNGPGIAANQREKVLRRFFRLEKSRNTSGSGLGLSLVAAIVRQHEGKLSLLDNLPGLTVEIHFRC